MTEQAHTDEQAPPTPAELLDDVLTDVSRHLRNLASWMPLVRELSDSRDGDDFLPQSTREALGRQHANRNAGAQLSYGTDARGTHSPAPGNMTSWALEADVEMTLRHLLKFVLRHEGIVDAKGRVLNHTRAEPVPAEETTEQLIGRIRATFMRITDLRIATAVVVDLEILAETVRRVLFGENRTQLPSACPYCARNSLVVYLETGVIRCERTRDAEGRTPACRCHSRHDVDGQPCPCATQPRFEHHWLRDRSGNHPHSWPSLHRALIHTTKEPT